MQKELDEPEKVVEAAVLHPLQFFLLQPEPTLSEKSPLISMTRRRKWRCQHDRNGERERRKTKERMK